MNIKLGNILIPRLDTFGDIILVEGFLRALSEKFPEAEITLLVREGYDQLALFFPENIIWLTTPLNPYKKFQDDDFDTLTALIDRLSDMPLDLLVSTTFNRTWVEDVIISTLACTKISLGIPSKINMLTSMILDRYNLSTEPDLGHMVYVDEFIHETEKYDKLWNAIFDDNIKLPLPQLNIDAINRQKHAHLFRDIGLQEKKYYVCLPGGTMNVPIKAWNVNKYADVIEEIYKIHSLTPLIIGNEPECLIVNKLSLLVQQKGIKPVKWIGQSDQLDILIQLIYGASFYIGNDSGPMHIAAALKIPTIGIFGGGTWPRFLPIGRQSIGIVGNMPCFGCYWDCIFEDAPCLDLVSKDDVCNAVGLIMRGEPLISKVIQSSVILSDDTLQFIDMANNKVKPAQIAANKEEFTACLPKSDPIALNYQQVWLYISAIRVSNPDASCSPSADLDLIMSYYINKITEMQEERLRSIEALESELQQSSADLNSQIAALSAKADGLRGQIAYFGREVADRDSQIAILKQDVSSLNAQITNLQQQFNAITSQLNRIFSSKSWLITKPFRFIRRNLPNQFLGSMYSKLYKCTRHIWRRVPVSTYAKKSLKSFLFRNLPYVFRQTSAYQNWRKLPPYCEIPRDNSILSEVFDAAYYLDANPEVAAAGIDPLRHYCNRGWLEGRNPHPLFNVIYYLQRYPDVKKACINPFKHYISVGWKEGRDPHPVFDSAYYSRTGWYSMNCGMSPLEYYLRYRCAASGIQLSGLDAILPRKQYFAKSCPEINHQTQPETRPLISVLMPVYNAPEKHLEDAILSVLAQSYGNWELCITDDGSTDACTKKVLDRYRMFNSRIKLKCLKHNTGISAATNEALDRALGEYVVMLDHDDTLDPSALLEFVFELNDHPDTDVIYSDQDFIDENGDTVYTFYKPDWSPEMFRGVMYVGHLLLVRRSLAVNIGGFDSGFDRVQDFEFMLRVGEHTERIRHIPKILYHWRMHPGSIAYNADAKGKVEPLQCAAVNAHMARLGLAGQAVPHPVHAHRALILPLPQTFLPSMTIIIGQSGDIEHLNSCLASLINTGMATEILLFAEADIHISWKEVRVLPLSVNDKSGDKMINSTQLINQAMRESGGDYILFMERPMKLSPGWAERLIMYSMRSDIMMVIPLVLNADKTVVEAGLILHPQQGIEPAMCGWNSDSDGLAGSLSCAREVSAVSAACVCFRHDTIRQIGEFDELYRIADFQMADVALRALNYGLKNIYVPSVTATYYETWPNIDSADRGLDRELFMNRWADTLQAGDRYHNPNYCKDSGGFVPDGLIAKRI